MSDKAIQAKRDYMNAYMKKYRQQNKEKIKRIQERYWEKKFNQRVKGENN